MILTAVTVCYRTSLSDQEMESSDDLIQVQNVCEIDTSNPLPTVPQFPFTANPAIHLHIGVSHETL